MRGAWRPFPNQSNMKRMSALGTKQPRHTRNRFRPGQKPLCLLATTNRPQTGDRRHGLPSDRLL